VRKLYIDTFPVLKPSPCFLLSRTEPISPPKS